MQPKFDIGNFLRDNFTDAETTHKMLTLYGYEVHMPAVYQWFYRGALPAKWVLTLAALREMETGKPVALGAYLR